MIYHRKLSFSAACLVFMLTAAFTSISAKTYASIGIIGAIEEEISSIKKETDVKSILNIGGRTFYVGKCGGQDIVLVKSEIGKVNAAITAQILIRDFRTESIIFTGVAGGIDPKLQPGDIVISTKMIQHDYGILSKETMKPWKLTVPGETGTRQYDGIDADPSLIEIAWTAAQNTRLQEVHYKLGNPKKRKPIVVKGIIATGDQFIESTKKREWLFEQFGASAVEMEGAAVAQVCATFGVPFVIIRSLSDLADDISSNIFMIMKNDAANNSAILVQSILTHMSIGNHKKGE